MISIGRMQDGIGPRCGSSKNVDIIKCPIDWSDAQGSHPVRVPIGAHEPGNLVACGSQCEGDRPTDIA